MIELVLGGARSGKSRYAEQQLQKMKKPLVYIATATAGDAEMAERIGHHQQQRADNHWLTIEEPQKLADVLKAQSQDKVILVDCLTLWLSNCLFADNEYCWHEQKTALLEVLPKLKTSVLLVSNEVGQGIVPLGEGNRRFVDEAGRLHQDVAKIADKVTFVTAGLAQSLKA